MTDPLRIEQDRIAVTKDDIVFLGCSITYGTALPTGSIKYSTQVAGELGLTEINLSKGSTGNYRSFDLFSQLDFTEGASVLIQLTELSRVRWYDNGINDRQLSVKPHAALLDVYHDKFLIYDLIRQLRLVVEYARVKKLKLVIWSIASLGNTELDSVLEKYLSKFPEYLFLDKRIGQENSYRVDNGLDGPGELGQGHPGPNSNKIIAARLLEHYRKLYEC